MHHWEKEIIRELAKEQLEISQLSVVKERVELWTRHNDLKGERPMIAFDTSCILEKGFHRIPKCETKEAIAMEEQIARAIVNYKMVGDDTPVTPEFICKFPHKNFQ